MECGNLEIIIHSANYLKDLSMFSKMSPYVFVSLSGDLDSKKKTNVHKAGGKNPKWNGEPMKFLIKDDLAKNDDLELEFRIMAQKSSGDKMIGKVDVPVKKLMENGDVEKFVSYRVMSPSGKPLNGILNFTYKFENVKVKNENKADTIKDKDLPLPEPAPASLDLNPYAGDHRHQTGHLSHTLPQPADTLQESVDGQSGGPLSGPNDNVQRPRQRSSERLLKKEKTMRAVALGMGIGMGLLGGVMINKASVLDAIDSDSD